MDEKVYLEQGNLRVSSTRVVINNTTYALANITSVSTSKTPARRTVGLLLLLLSIFVLPTSIGLEATVGMIVGGLMLALALWQIVSAKPTYHVALGTAAGEKHALDSKDKASVDSIVEAINTAIIERG